MSKKSEKEKLHMEVVKQMLTLATAGFGLVAALAWNSLIQTLVDKYLVDWLPVGGEIASLAVYATVVTILAVVVTLQLSKLLNRLESEKDN